MLFSLLTIACILVTFLVSWYRLWQNPPKLNITMTILPPQMPERFNLSIEQSSKQTIENFTRQQIVPADVEVKPLEEPIPEDILDYISQESETHAQDTRKRRVRALKRDVGSWDAAFRLLQREDNSLDF